MRLAALSLPDDLIHFFERHPTLSEGWQACERPEWLMQLALHAHVDRRLLVMLAVPIVERALARHSLYIDSPTVARRWARDAADGAEAWAAGFRASDQSKAFTGDESAALRAGGALAFACDASSAPAYYAARGHLVDAIALAMQSLPNEASAFADALRRGLPFTVIEEALRVRVAHHEPPSHATGERPKQPYSWRPPLAIVED